jgi:hypothetical protein
MAQYLPLPDGTSVTIRPGETPEQAWARAQQQYPEAFQPAAFSFTSPQTEMPELPPEEPKSSTFGSELKRGFQQVGSSLRTTGESIFDSPEAAAQRGLERGQAISEEAGEGPSWERIKRVYEQQGLLGAAGQVASDVPKALAGQAANLAGMAGSAKLGAMAGTAVAPGAGTVIGGALGAGAYLLPQFFGSNVERQAAEDIEQGRPVDIETGKALGAATLQAGTEAAGTAFILGKRLVSTILGTDVTKAAASKAAQAALTKKAEQSLTRALAGGAAKGLVEIPVEISQQIIERAQAGMDVLSDEALTEYGNAAYQAGLIGPTLGSVGGYSERGGAKQQVEKQQEEEARIAAAQQAQKQAKEDAAYKSSDAYVTDIAQKYEAFQEQVKALRAQSKAKVEPEDLAGKAAQKEAGKALSELVKENRELIKEYNAVKGKLPAIKEKQRVAGMSPMDYMLEQSGEIAPTKRAPSAGLESSDADLGFVPPQAPGQESVQYAAERVRLAQDQLPAPDVNDYVEYILQDPVRAQQFVESQAPIPGLAAKDQRLVLKGVQDRLALQRKETERQQREENRTVLTEQTDLLRAQKPMEIAPDRFAEQQEQVAQDTETQQRTYMDELGFAVPMLERATERPADIVPVPETVPLVGAEKVEALRTRLDDLEAKLKPTIAAPSPEGRKAAAETRDKAAAELSWLSQNESDPLTQEILRVRNTQTAALMELQDTLDDIRSGTFLGGKDSAMGTTTRGFLNKALADARSTYVKAMLEEAAIYRRAAGERPLTYEEATQAAMEARQTLDELIERGQAYKGEARGLRYEQRGDLDLEGSNLQRAVRNAERRVKQTRGLLDELAAEAESGVSRRRQFELDYERTQAEKKLAQRMLDLEAAKKKFAESPKKLVPDLGVWRWGDVRDLAERPFGNYGAALDVQLEQLGEIRQRLNQPVARQRAPEGLRVQFAETEAKRTAEARGETATTLEGELRRRTEFVRDKMAKMKAMRPQAAGVLNKAADLMDAGQATRDLLDAVEPVVDTINNGQMPFARDLRAISDAIKAAEPTAREQQEAGQRPLFDEIGDRKQRADETGYVKKTSAEFENSPPMRKAREAVQKARKAEEAFRQFLKNTAKLREQQKRQANLDRIATVEKLQSALSAQRRSLQEAELLAEAEAREALQLANKAAAEPQLQAAQKALREARAALQRQQQRQDLFTAEELARQPKLAQQLQKQVEAEQTLVAEAQQALDALLTQVVADVDSAQLQEAVAQDNVLAFERDYLAKLQQTLEELSAKQNAPSEERVRAAKAAADQRAAVAVAEKKARDAKDAAAKQRAALQERMAKGFDLPQFKAEDLGSKKAIRAQLDAIETQLSMQDEGVQRAQERLAKAEAQPVDTKQKRRVRDAKKALALAEDAAGAKREQLEEIARGLRARLGSHDYLTAEQRAAEKLAQAQAQQRQISTESMKEIEEARRRTMRATGPVTRGKATGETRTGAADRPIDVPGATVTEKEQQRKVAKQEQTAGVGQRYAGALTESKQPKPTALPVSSKDMQEANRIADELRKKTPAQKRKEVKEAAAIAKELEKSLGQQALTDDDAASNTYASEVRDGEVYEVREEAPLDSVAAEAALDGRLLDVLARLETNGSSPFVKELAKRLRPLVMRTKLRIAADGISDGKGGFLEGDYDPETNTVRIDRVSLNEDTLLHEVVHAVTLNTLNADPKTLTAEQRQARAELESLFQNAKNDPSFSKEYAKKNIAEFVSELMSNTAVRNKVDALQPTLLERIYDAILRMLGVSPSQTRSERAVENAYKLFAPSRMAKGARVASVMRGVFPGSGPKYSAVIPADLQKRINPAAPAQTVGQKVSAAALGFRTLALDRWAPMEYLLKQGVAKGKIDEAKATQMRIHMRLHEDTNRFAVQALANGVPQLQEAGGKRYYGGDVSDTNIRTVVQQVSEAGVGNNEAAMNMWQKWMEGNRIISNKLGFDVLDRDNPAGAEQTFREIDAIVKANPKISEAFEKARATYRQYNKDLMRQATEAGTLPKDLATKLGNADYIPFYRVEGDVVQMYGVASRPITIGSILNQPYLKELVGDDKGRLPALSAIVQNTSLLTKMNIRNLQAKDAANALKDLGLGKIVQGEGPANVIRFKSNGLPYWIKLEGDAFPEGVTPEMLLSGMQGIKTTIPTVIKAMAVPTRLLRNSITRMPLYVIRQMIRDPLFAWLTTGGKFTPVVSSIKELTKIRRGLSPTEETLARSGAISSNVMTGDYQDMARALSDLGTTTKGWNWAMAGLDNLAMQADASTRAVLYDSFRKQGMDHVDALLGAAESMNFSRRGTSSSLYALSAIIPFFNAQLQGIDALYRTFRGDTVLEKKLDVRNKLYQRGALMLATTFAYAAMMQDDEAYKNATPQERAMNWFVRLPGVDEAVRIPIPFEPGLIFKAIPETIFNTMFGDTTAKEAVRQIGAQVVASTPGILPSAAKPLIELATNYSFYTDRPLESGRDLAVDKEFRYRENTTELAKLLGQTGALSPIQIEHLVRGYFSSAGILLMSMANYPLRPFVSEGAPELPEKLLSQMPVFGAGFQPNDGRGMIDAAYRDVERFERAHKTFNRLITQGNRAEAMNYASKFAREITLASTGGAFTQQMGEFADMRRQVAASGMDPAQKREMIDQIRKAEIAYSAQIRAIAKQTSE